MRPGHADRACRPCTAAPARPRGMHQPSQDRSPGRPPPRQAWGTSRHRPDDRSVKGLGNDCAQAGFWLDAHGLQQVISCARTGFTLKSMISLASRLVIICPSFRKPTKTGAWNPPPTPSSTRLSTGGVDSLAKDDAVASGHASKPRPVKSDPERLCTAACAAAFSRENGATLKPTPVFHAQAIDSKRHERGHIFAIFPEAPIFQGVERVSHKAMHSVIHSLCG